MTARFRRAIVASLLAPWLIVPPTIGREHAHEVDGDHAHSVVHRHLQPHHADSHAHDFASLADDDSHIVWLDNATLHQGTYQLATPAVAPGERFDVTPPSEVWVRRRDYGAARPHGPPGATLALRGPPRLSL